MEKMDPRDDRTSIIRAEFKTCLGNQLKSKSVSPVLNPPASPPVANVLNNNASGAGLPPDTGSSSLPQLPPLTFSAIGAPTTSIPSAVQPRQRLPSVTERSNFTIHERALSFISPSTTNSSATEKKGQDQRQPSLNTKLQASVPSEANAVPSPSHSSGPPTPIPTTTPSTVDTKITKTEIPSLTLNTTSTVTPVTNMQPHHSPTTTLSILTNPHHSPTQSVFTNPHHGSEHSESPTLNQFSLPPLRDLNNNITSSSINPNSPIPHSAGSSQAKSVRSPLRTSFDNVQGTSTTDNSSLDVNSTQLFSNVLLEDARTKTQDTVTNQLNKVNDREIQQSETPSEAETSQSPQARSGVSLSPVTTVVTTGDVAIDSAQRNNRISAAIWKSSVNPSASSRVVGRLSPTRSGLGRKPSGARAQLTPRSYNRVGPESFSSQTVTEEEEESMSEKQDQESNDANAEALAALTYLDMADSQDVSSSATPPSPPRHRSPIITPPSAERPRFQLSDGPPIPPAVSSPDSVPFRSSFAPSSKVAERIMKAQAQQAALEAAKHRPGRANGKKKAKTTATGAWESSDEEEDEEEDDDEDVDSDPEIPMRGPQSTSSQQGFSSSSSSRPPQSTSDTNVDGPPSHLRPPRNLPVPPGRLGKCYNSVRCVDVSKTALIHEHFILKS